MCLYNWQTTCSRSPSPLISTHDKMKLLEIAKANVLAQHQAGIAATTLSSESKVNCSNCMLLKNNFIAKNFYDNNQLGSYMLNGIVEI